MADELDYPVLFGTTQATWGPMDLRFELLTGEADSDRIAHVYVVPFIGAACVVVGFEHGDWGPAGGGLEPGESIRAALERELAEEAGGGCSPTPRSPCYAATPGPRHRIGLICRIPTSTACTGYGEVELVGPPQLHDGAEGVVAVEVMPPAAAAAFLAGNGHAWEADLNRLAAQRRAAHTQPP